MEKTLETAWVGPQIGWSRLSGNHQGGADSVSQADGDSDMVPACQFCVCFVRGGLRKEQWPLPALLSERKLPLQLLALIPDNSVSPCMSLVPFELLPQC